MKNAFYCLGYLLIGLSIASCNQISAIQFNDKIVKTNDTIYHKGFEIGQMLKADFNTKNFSNLTEPINKLRKYINEKSDEIQKMDAVAGGENFKKAMLDYLSFENHLVDKSFIPFTKLNATSTPEEINSVVSNFQSAISEEDRKLQNVKDEQQKFAEKNNIKIQPR